MAMTSLAAVMSKPALARDALARSAQADHDPPEGAIVHVERPLPEDAAGVERGLAEMEAVVDRGGQELWAAVIAWKSPVNWRLIWSTG
jgi:hypothetical protein